MSSIFDDPDALMDVSEWEATFDHDEESLRAEAEAEQLGLLAAEDTVKCLPCSDSPGTTSASPAIQTPSRKRATRSEVSSVEKTVGLPISGGVAGERKRLRFKQAVAEPLPPADLAPPLLIDGAAPGSHPLLARYLKLDPTLRRKASKRHSQQRYRLSQKLTKDKTVHIAGEMLTCNGDAAEATAMVERALFKTIAADTSKTLEDRGYALSQLARLEDGGDLGPLDQSTTPTVRGVPSVLLTYNGPDGLVDINSLELRRPGSAGDASPLSVPEKFALLRAMRTEDLCLLLQKNATVQKFFLALESTAVNTINRLHTPHWAVAVELCTSTLASSDVLRIHGHMWLALKNQILQLNDVAIFDGQCVPWANWSALKFFSGCSTRSANSAMAGAFYCTLCKIGTILQKSTCEPWVDFSVRDVWITSMFTANKITYETARESYVRSVHHVVANVAQLDYCEKQRRARELRLRVLRIEEELRLTMKPWKKVPAVDEWAQQYEKSLPRYCFLVLDGDSRFGKTKYALSLVPLGRMFYSDCTSGVPDLRDFDSGTYSGLLLDELSPRHAISLKKPLQASNELATMGVSPTMMSAYTIHTWKVRIVVCTNLWKTGLRKMKKVDRRWLEANSIYVPVGEPLWQEDA